MFLFYINPSTYRYVASVVKIKKNINRKSVLSRNLKTPSVVSYLNVVSSFEIIVYTIPKSTVVVINENIEMFK
jgi:hypothetical protein